MSRKYTHIPEPRYVKLAQKVVEGGESTPSSYKIVDDIYSVDKGFRVKYIIGEDEAEIEIPLEGTDDIVVDIDEANQEINIHLDNNVRTKLARMLMIPASIPAEEMIVAIGTNGAQTNLTLGEGLKIEDGIIKSTVTYSLDGTTLNITNE